MGSWEQELVYFVCRGVGWADVFLMGHLSWAAGSRSYFFACRGVGWADAFFMVHMLRAAGSRS